VSELSDTLFFKTNEGAFEYACKYLDNSMANQRPVLGIVLAVKGQKCIVKFANSADASIPDQSAEQLLERAEPSTIGYGVEPIDGVPMLKRGDLVMCVADPGAVAVGKPGFASIIIAKAKPHYFLSQGGWQRFPVEH
jgi:hypothetical protein